MKGYLILICLICLTAFTHAQNTFPANGDVGIGTNTPSARLDVNGNMIVDSSLVVKDSVIIQRDLIVDQDFRLYGEFTGFDKAKFKDWVIFTDNVKFKNLQLSNPIGKNRFISINDNGKVFDIPNLYTSSQNVIEIDGNALVSGDLETKRITALPGDSIIWFGDSTIGYHQTFNRLFPDLSTGGIVKGIGLGTNTFPFSINGLALGNYSYTRGNYSTAIGNYVQIPSGTDNAFLIGTGSGIGFSNLLQHDISNSLLVGFEQNKVLYVGRDAGPGQTVGSGSSYGVGINTQYIPEGYALAVEGTAIFEEVWVKPRADWPDYVFSNEYERMSLEELERFIAKHKHLPKVPSALQVQENGVALGEMQRTLLEKVEELTLYTIELKKELDALKEKNQILEQKLQE